MDMATDFTTGILAVVVEVATVGVGSIGGIGFADKICLVGIGWVITLTLYLLFTGALALLLLSTFLGSKVFLVEEFLLWERALVHGCDWGWGWGLGPSLPSSSRYVFIFLIKAR